MNFGLRKADCGLEDGIKIDHGDKENNQRVTEKDLKCLEFKVPKVSCPEIEPDTRTCNSVTLSLLSRN